MVTAETVTSPHIMGLTVGDQVIGLYSVANVLEDMQRMIASTFAPVTGEQDGRLRHHLEVASLEAQAHAFRAMLLFPHSTAHIVTREAAEEADDAYRDKIATVIMALMCESDPCTVELLAKVRSTLSESLRIVKCRAPHLVRVVIAHAVTVAYTTIHNSRNNGNAGEES